MSHSNSLSDLQGSQVNEIKERQKRADQILQKLAKLLDEGKQQHEEAVRRLEAELRQAMEIPTEYWPSLMSSLKEVIENMQKQSNLTEKTLSHSQNLPDRELVRQASGGLTLQGIYKTSYQRELLEKREELISVPNEFLFSGPEQGTRMETKEFTSSQAESNFTQTIEKLGFSASAIAKGSGWGFNLETGMDHNKHSESKETKQSHDEHSYFCSTKFMYVPLVSCHFPFHELKLSKAALLELKGIEEILSFATGPAKVIDLRHRIENFFQRFGSHANQGPLHFGGIYWWKAVSEGFQSEQLTEVKQQSVEMLETHVRGSYSGLDLTAAAGLDVASSQSTIASQNTTFKTLQTRVQLSITQTGGPLEANSLVQWKTGLVASNRTWCVIDRGLQLVPIWEIILSNHKSDFNEHYQIANCLRENYNDLTRFSAQLPAGEDMLSAEKEARVFLETVKSWEISNPEEYFKQMIDFMQELSERVKNYDIWISICLTDCSLQKFLLSAVNFCRNSSMYNSQFIKSQLRSLLDPHIYSVKNFPQKDFIMEWIFQSESEKEDINITQFSDLVKMLTQTQTELMEVKAKSQSPEAVEEAQRKAIYEISASLGCFLNYLQVTQQLERQHLLLSIAANVGYNVVNNTFQYFLDGEELSFLLYEMKTAHDKYQELQNICSYRAQAFLLLTVLTTTFGVRAVSPEDKRQRLALTRQHMGQSLTTEVVQVLNKYKAYPDWENLEKDLRFLMNGEIEATVLSLQMDDVKKELQSLLHENKPSKELCDTHNYKCEVDKNTTFIELLQRLGLKDRFPKRMTRSDFHLICKTSVHKNNPSSEQELPFYFLQKLLVLDYGLRYLVFKDDKKTDSQVSPDRLNKDNEAFDPFEDNLEDDVNISSASIPKSHIHPMDIQMAILHCTDDFARQYILGKLATCQFALPLLVPSPCNAQIEFYLWSLNQIRRSWQERKKSPNENHNYNNQQMFQVPTPIVSFIRVGDGLSASKSQIMNCLLSKRKHDTFFHRHCKGSSKNCLLMGGVVEICWFCPGGEEEDRFENCLTFANLHGNAKEYQQQLIFLQEVSSLLIILMTTTDDNKDNRKCVRQLSQSSKPFILLFDDKEQMAKISGQRVKIGVKNRNEADLTEELTTTIQILLKFSNTIHSLEDCAQVARKQGFLVDEDQRDCREAKEKAEVLRSLFQKMDISQMKNKLLPLQGSLWHNWCKKDKELYHLKEKGNRSIEQHKSETETEKQKIRHEQFKRAFPLNPLMKNYLQILQNFSETHSKLYFLQWLAVFLDNLISPHLEKLKEKKKALWSQMQTEKQKTAKTNVPKDKGNDINAIVKTIADSSLSIEHILREVGQIYEALEESSFIKNNENLCHSLPQIAADLLISGVPIELMDGEASYVPLKWVAAVLDKVTEKLGDKRLFVLSILGIQSSGKSTLLNALFGLQLTVSAGRCTQGAYMQLLKVEETFAEELGFDFILVVDTEGLRAPELIDKSQIHDNELATFVIGLGNLTLINIFGENPSEMQDILQIVVQAFLRMKQVKISPSCLFVHQNVGEVMAQDQTLEGRRRLEQKLDEMTALAAEQEQCSDITFFTDVINFDVNTQVHYFAHLWDGNPPMAPPNPRYSHNVQELKCQILETAKQQSRGSIMKISDVKMRTQDLWRALVSENFIFSFRNTQEVMAMSKLETMYNSWTWDIRSHVLGLQNQLMNQIQNENLQTLWKSMLQIQVSKNYDLIKQKMEKYFEDEPDSEILFQWKANFEYKLRILKDALISEVQRKVEAMIHLKESQRTLDSRKSTYKKEIVEKSQQLALSVKGRKLSNEELYGKFDQLWRNWVCDVTSSHQPVAEPNIDKDIEDILFHHFNKENNIVDIISNKYGENFQIKYDQHVQMNRKYFFQTLKLEVQDKESIDKTTERILLRFYDTINKIQKQQQDYNSYYFHEILRIMEEEVKSAPTQERYTFKTEYKIDLSLSLFKRAAKTFREMHRTFKEANDPVNYLERKKYEFFMSFKISCEGATNIKTSVDFLWNKLTPAISTTLRRNLVSQMASHIQSKCSEFNANRSNLEKYILISLAEEENFKNYWMYIQDPQAFFKIFIQRYVQTYYSGEGCKKMKSFLKENIENIKQIIRSAIHDSTEIAKDKNSNETASEWLNVFCDKLGSDFAFPRHDLISIEHQEIKDIYFLKDAMSDALDPVMKDLEQKCSSMSKEEEMIEVSEILSEHLCGCSEQCPFCLAICTNTIPNHDGDHSMPFHRTQAVAGMKWEKTDQFSIDCCTTLVASDSGFYINEKKLIPYKTYRDAGGIYATWKITPDSSVQSYWKWFVCHFRSELEEKYHLKFESKGQIPDAWYKITKETVLDELKKQLYSDITRVLVESKILQSPINSPNIFS